MIHTTAKKGRKKPGPAGIYPCFYALHYAWMNRAGSGCFDVKKTPSKNSTPFLALKTQVKTMKYSELKQYILN